MKCASCNHRYCEFCISGSKYEERESNKEMESDCRSSIDILKNASADEVKDTLIRIACDSDKYSMLVKEIADYISVEFEV